MPVFIDTRDREFNLHNSQHFPNKNPIVLLKQENRNVSLVSNLGDRLRDPVILLNKLTDLGFIRLTVPEEFNM